MPVHVLFSSFGDDRLATTTQLSGLRLHNGATGLTNIAGRGSGGCVLYFSVIDTILAMPIRAHRK